MTTTDTRRSDRFTFAVIIEDIVPKPFARATGKQYRAFNKPKAVTDYLTFKNQVAARCKEEMMRTGNEPYAGIVDVDVVIWMPGYRERGKRRWDLANVYKAVEDAMAGIVIVNDWQVEQIIAHVRPAVRQRTDIELWVRQA